MAKLYERSIAIIGLTSEAIKEEFFNVFDKDFLESHASLEMDLLLEIPEVEYLANLSNGLGLVSQFLTELIKDALEKRIGYRPCIHCYRSNCGLMIRKC